MIAGWVTRLFCLGGLVIASSHATTFSKCDVNQDGTTTVADVQQEINEALGAAAPANDLNGSGSVNVVDVQIVIDAVVLSYCAADGTSTTTVTGFNPKSGPISTLVSVAGSNFGAAPQILMSQLGGGSINPPVSTSSAASLSFVVPDGAATGPITVMTSGGSATTSSPFTVTPSAAFTISAGPASATVMQGQSASYAVSLASTNGFNQLAQLSVTGVPAGITAAFKPPAIPAGQTSVLTLTAPIGQPIAASNLSISASATIDGLAGTQSASVSLAVAAPTTSLVGRTVVTDALETPLAGVTISALGQDGNGNNTGCTNFTTVSDAAGNFALTNLPMACTGPQMFGFNGNTVTAPAGKYGGANLAFTLVSGQVTASPILVHLPRVDTAETFLVQQNAAANQSYSFQSIPGLSVTVYAGTTFTMPDGTQPNPFPLNAVYVPTDRLPDVKPFQPTMLGPFFVSFQPAGTSASQPAAVSFPNTLNTPAGTTSIPLMALDPTHGTMIPYGTGTISADSTQIVPDADPAHPGHLYGLLHFDWEAPMFPPANPNAPGGDGPCPTCTCPAGSGPTCGQPVDISSGLDEMQTVDVTFGGNRGDITLTRTLRGNSVGGPNTTDMGPFGFRGNHNYSLRLNTGLAYGSLGFSLIMPDGRWIPFSSVSNFTLINITDPEMQGAVFTTAPDQSATLRLKDGTSYHFASLVPTGAPVTQSIDLLVSITDPNGNTVTLARNPLDPNQITAITDAVGRSLIFTYGPADLITSIEDPLGRTVNYTYATMPYGAVLTSFTDQNGGVWQYAYEANGNLSTVTDPRGVVVEQNTYDANFRVISQRQADGSQIQLSYTLLNPLVASAPVISTVETDQLGRPTTYRFNSQGYLVQVTDPLGQNRVFNRAQGTNLLLSMTGPGVCPTCGDPTLGDLSFTYDANGNLLTSTDSLGDTYTYTYDPTFSRMTSLTDPTSAVSTFQYDGNGNLTAATDPRGDQTTFAYGGFGLRSSTTDAAHQTTTFSYDSSANLSSFQDPLGNTSMIAYDPVSRPTQVTDPTGAQSSLTWDPLNRLVQFNDATGGSTYYQYDAVDNLTNLTDPRGFQTVFLYDSLSRLTNRIDALGRGEIYAYDSVGNLTAHTDRRGQVGSLTYDALNRLVAETYHDALVMRSYDANSRLQQVNDSQGGVFSYQYDTAGRLLHGVAPQGAITYTRDGLGRVASRQVAGQAQVTYQYDAAGNLTQAAMPQASLSATYDVRNRPLSQSRSNGVSTAYTYDALERVQSIAHQAGGNSLANFSYAYDAAGNRSAAATDLAQPLTTQGTTGTFDPANEMNAFASRTFTYDANGNRLTDAGAAGTTSYVWDGRNRLQSITQPNGAVTRFTYDFHRNLTQQVATTGGGSATTGYFMDDMTNVVAIYGGAAGTLSLLTGHGIDDHLATINSAGQAEFALTDALGSVVAASGASEGLDGKDDYEPFGQTTSSGASFPFAFTGREPVTGNIYYYRNRFYDSSVGRFLSEDPATLLTGDSSLYTYAFNAPVGFTDPLGTNFSSNLAPPGPDAPQSAWNDYLVEELLANLADFLQVPFVLEKIWDIEYALKGLFKQKPCDTASKKRLAEQIAAKQQELQALLAQYNALNNQGPTPPGSNPGPFVPK